jgi:glycosyltransferase involved in cell wall biosynthesis
MSTNKDNILYIGPYREFTGMGNASRHYIRSLLHSGHNICIRPIYNEFNAYPETEISSDILDLEKNYQSKYHKVIQHCYPHQLVYNSKFDQHIGIIHIETNQIDHNITNHLALLDNIVVGSSVSKRILYNSGIKVKIDIIPEPIDLLLIKEYRKNNEPDVSDQNFKFYTIASFSDRKNLQQLLLSFLLFSNYYDNADLIIKLKQIKHTADSNAYVDYEFEKFYSIIRNNFTKKPKIFIGDTSYNNMLYIHNNNNCYISTSHGESFGYPILEAVAFNKNIIMTKNTGCDDLISQCQGLGISSREVACKDKDRIFPFYNSIYNTWNEADINGTVDNMFKAVNESNEAKDIRIAHQNKIIEQYTYDSVAKLWNNI